MSLFVLFLVIGLLARIVGNTAPVPAAPTAQELEAKIASRRPMVWLTKAFCVALAGWLIVAQLLILI